MTGGYYSPCHESELVSPELEERLLREPRARRAHRQDEGDDAEGGVDGHEGGAEGGRRGLAAEQQQEAEEADQELRGGVEKGDNILITT